MDERIEAVAAREPLARYEVEIGGRRTVMKLRPSNAQSRYPGARPLDKMRRPPTAPAPTPSTSPVPPARIEPLGGGWWRLTDGTRIRGREAAVEAQAVIDGSP